jgi:hypothetical protein
VQVIARRCFVVPPRNDGSPKQSVGGGEFFLEGLCQRHEIASAQPNGIVLSFIVIEAEPRNDGAFDGWFWFDLLPSRTVPVWRVAFEDGPGLACCLRGRSLVKVPSEAACT